MLDQLFNLVKEYGQHEVVDNPDIPNEQNEAVMAEASHAVAGTLQNELAQGNLPEIMKMFNANSSSQIMSSPVAQNMQSGFMDNITQKLGINKNVAAGLAATLIPIVISKLVKRTKSPAPQDSGFSLDGLLASLTGGSGGGGIDFGNILGQLTGGGHNGSAGGIDLGGLVGPMSSGARQQQQSGGLGSLISSFFGR